MLIKVTTIRFNKVTSLFRTSIDDTRFDNVDETSNLLLNKLYDTDGLRMSNEIDLRHLTKLNQLFLTFVYMYIYIYIYIYIYMFLFIYLFIFHRYREIPIGTKSDTIIKKFFKCNEVMKLSEELLILSNERLKDGNEWLKASIKQCALLALIFNFSIDLCPSSIGAFPSNDS